MSDLTFKDSKGRIWNLALNMGVARVIDKSDFSDYYGAKFSFIKPEKEVFSAMVSDNKFMFAVIWAVCINQAKKKFQSGEFLFGLYDEQNHPTDPDQVEEAFTKHYEEAELEFVSSLDGNAISAGRTAFWRSLADFFQDQATVLSLLERQYVRLRKKVDESMTAIEPDMEAGLDQALSKDMKTIRTRIAELTTRDE